MKEYKRKEEHMDLIVGDGSIVNMSVEGRKRMGKEVVYEDLNDLFDQIMEDYKDGEESDAMEDYEDGEESEGEDNVDTVDANDGGLNLKDPIFDDITIEDSKVRCKEFETRFLRYMPMKTSTDEFDDKWRTMIPSLGLEDNVRVKWAYGCKNHWANYYLRGISLALYELVRGARECMHFLCSYLNKKLRLFEFFRSFELAIDHLRRNNL
ncbi:hypothetical protein M9H77_31683 [Catharanthus roseus]|uniref:Uncharacterized protein n=1 Tax=Catharanthus roseus TaxID=4058 RepID=A0ACC0A4N8_CATRO|nr:hypothetical protein M9H77_31683 [Catharanthus roseus]